jgi:hypothetical protein
MVVLAGSVPLLLLLLLAPAADAQPNKPHPCGGPGEPKCTVIQNLHELDCKTSQYAFQYATAKVKSSPKSLHDALNLWNCTAWLTPEQSATNAAVLAAGGGASASRTGWAAAAAAAIFVSPSGADSAAGTEAAPLRTLGAALALAAKSHAAAVVLRGGKYYLNSTLELTLEHSGLHIAAYEGEHVTVSGGVPLQLHWEPYQGSILKAEVALPSVLSEAERAHWTMQRAGGGDDAATRSKNATHDWGPPPAKWNTLFADGVRQVVSLAQRDSLLSCHVKLLNPLIIGVPVLRTYAGGGGGGGRRGHATPTVIHRTTPASASPRPTAHGRAARAISRPRVLPGSRTCLAPRLWAR